MGSPQQTQVQILFGTIFLCWQSLVSFYDHLRSIFLFQLHELIFLDKHCRAPLVFSTQSWRFQFITVPWMLINYLFSWKIFDLVRIWTRDLHYQANMLPTELSWLGSFHKSKVFLPNSVYTCCFGSITPFHVAVCSGPAFHPVGDKFQSAVLWAKRTHY